MLPLLPFSPLSSDSESEVASGEIPILLRREAWRRLLQAGVLSNVEFTTMSASILGGFFSLSLLDLVLRGRGGVGLQIDLEEGLGVFLLTAGWFFGVFTPALFNFVSLGRG